MTLKKYVLISLVTREPLLKETYGNNLLSLFYDKYQNLAPQFANFFEPVNKPVRNTAEALEYWDGSGVPIFMCRRKNSVVGSWWISQDRSQSEGLIFEYNWNKNIDWHGVFLDLLSVVNPFFGYIHIFTGVEIEPAAPSSAIGNFLTGTTGYSLKKGIPNLGWGTYFGEEYVKELDIPLLENHGFKVEKLGEGYTFNITDNLSDVIDNYDAFDERRKLLKSLFRPELFQKYEAYG